MDPSDDDAVAIFMMNYAAVPLAVYSTLQLQYSTGIGLNMVPPVAPGTLPTRPAYTVLTVLAILGHTRMCATIDDILTALKQHFSYFERLPEMMWKVC